MTCNLIKHYLLAGLLAIGLCLFLTAANRTALGQIGSGRANEDKQIPDFVSKEGGFKVNFPVTPEKGVSNIGDSSNEIFLTKYEALSGSWLYQITYFDFPYAKDTAESKSLYDQARNRILAKPGRKLIVEKDFYLNKRLGREILIEEDGSTSIQRLVLVEGRFFQLVVFMPFRFSDSSASVRASFLKTANKFLDSFVVNKTPLAQKLAPQLPGGFGIKIENGVFSSEYLGFTMKLPSNLTVLSAEEIASLTAVTDKISGKKMKTEGYVLSLPGLTKPLVMMIKKPPIEGHQMTFSILAERLNLPTVFKPLSMVKEIERFSSEKLGRKITKPSRTVMLGGVEFAFLEIFDAKQNFKQRIYVANRKELALEITIAFQNEADATKTEAALQTIRFK